MGVAGHAPVQDPGGELRGCWHESGRRAFSPARPPRRLRVRAAHAGRVGADRNALSLARLLCRPRTAGLYRCLLVAQVREDCLLGSAKLAQLQAGQVVRVLQHLNVAGRLRVRMRVAIGIDDVADAARLCPPPSTTPLSAPLPPPPRLSDSRPSETYMARGKG